MLQDALSQGFAVASHALDNAGHNCNMVTQAESLIVTKELVAERFGPIRYTIGSGCSGGSLVQQQIANSYPGVYQGITPQCSFTDAWSSAQQYVDYVGLRRFLEGSGGANAGIAPAQWPSIYGHANPANQITFTTAIPNSGDPSRSCPGVPAAQVFTTASQTGVRCSFQDYMINVFGPITSGPDAGKAHRPISNVGIQYGLSGLLSGLGGNARRPDPPAADRRPVRRSSTPASAATTSTSSRPPPAPQRRPGRPWTGSTGSGAVNTAAHLDEVAIIDLGGTRAGRVPRRLPQVRDARPAGPRARHQREPGLLGGPDPAAGRRLLRRRLHHRRWTSGWPRSRPTPARSRWRRRSSTPRARPGIAPPLRRRRRPGPADHRRVRGRRGRDAVLLPRIEAGGGDAVVGFTDDRLDCDTVPIEDLRLRRHDLRRGVHPRPAGHAAGRPSRTASATTASPARASRPRRPG